MAGLLYYIPERAHAELGDAAELGLQYAFERDLSPRSVRANGPDGGQGVVIVDSTRVPKAGHYPEEQTWLKIPGNPVGAWVGRYNDEPVRPEDVARDEQLPGHLVQLLDGQEWLAPVGRGLAETDSGEWLYYDAVPRRMALDPEGNWSDGEIVERYRPLWAIVTEWWDRTGALGKDDFEETFDIPRLADVAAEVLAVNYRLNRAEVWLLGLFDRLARLPEAVLDITIDMPTIKEQIRKKKVASEADG